VTQHYIQTYRDTIRVHVTIQKAMKIRSLNRRGKQLTRDFYYNQRFSGQNQFAQTISPHTHGILLLPILENGADYVQYN
jgi:integrase/recombinase XerD